MATPVEPYFWENSNPVNLDQAGNLRLRPATFFFESYSDNITASAIQTQAGATQLVSECNRITTVAANFNGVALPSAQPGCTIMVTNHGANSVQVYGQVGSTDTINDVAYANGISQMPGSVVIYSCYTAGAWYSVGEANGYYQSYQTQSLNAFLAANSAGTQAAGTPLPAMTNIFTAVGGNGYSATLPTPPAGGCLPIVVVNTTANSLNVFPAPGGTINALAANAAFAVAGGTVTVFYSATATQWWTK